MNLFDELVNEALKNQPDLFSLRMVVEKELLHHDILRVMRDNHLIAGLTFIGGTCLRDCYGSMRLSEDLDFTGGLNFSRETLSNMGQILIENLQNKYNLTIHVSEPEKDISNVDTWKIKIETRPEKKHFPAQRINIDICAVNSYEKQPMMLLNPYQVNMGTSGLIIQAQSREEIYADKLIAFAFRPNRIKYRDLWDISWLHGQGLRPRYALIPHKLNDRRQTLPHFFDLFQERLKLLEKTPTMATEFLQEMRRFLPVEYIHKRLEQDDLWRFILYLMKELEQQLQKTLKNTQAPPYAL